MQTTVRGWELSVERGPGWLFVKPSCLDEHAFDTPALADEVWSLLEQHLTYRLVLELDEIELLRSYLLGQLILLQKRICEHGGVIRVCGLTPYNREVLELHQLHGRLPAYGDIEDAVMGGRGWKPR